MTKITTINTVYFDENQITEIQLSFEEVCEICAIPEENLIDWIDQGLYAAEIADINSLQFDSEMLKRLQIAQRLHIDLNINRSGVILALDLLDQIQSLRKQIDILTKLLHDK